MDEYLTQIALRIRILCDAMDTPHDGATWTLPKLHLLVNRIKLLRQLAEINFN